MAAYNEMQRILNSPLDKAGVIEAEEAKLIGSVPFERIEQFFTLSDKIERQNEEAKAKAAAAMVAATPDILAFFDGKDGRINEVLFRDLNLKLSIVDGNIVISSMTLV